MTQALTYLITGASRGIGRGFVFALLQKPSTTVIAAVRDPSKASSKSLADLPKAAGSKLIIVKIDSVENSDASNAVRQLQEDHDIKHLDVVIANAGIAHSGKPVIANSTDVVLEHFSINAIGPLILFQATAGLLKASKSGRPTFIAISTLIGSISSMELLAQFPSTMSPYGASKAALNWFVRRIHFEEPWLTSFVFHPGLVQTDMASRTIEGTSLKLEDLGAITVEESVTGMIKTIESASREISGTFQNYDGTVVPW
ncbi:short-chain dehydrogenase [Phlyctema vagabunda]|uniref:Short-chain dehydrogenase n=1 Tax=Phlyctema vagabunda TaxID=108571 RepID=A0ABR4P5V9_9HELO